MEKPKVTLQHTEGYLLGGFMLLITVAGYALSRVQPADPFSRNLSTVIAIIMTVFGGACFYCGGFTETLDENGIHIKRPFYSKSYLWSDVVKVSVEVVQQYKSKGPQFSLRINNRRFSLPLEYTKRTMACITCYYGQPDEDLWGKPLIFM